MAERYTRISENHDILYFASSPLTIEATSLLKDNKQEKLIAQIKLQNISSKIITAVFLKLSLLDASGSYLEDIEYQYLDLYTRSHEEFGQKNAIVLPNPYARAFELSLLKVVYSDGDVWEASTDNSFKKLAQQRNINNVFSQSEVEKYQSFLGEKALYEPVESEDIWLCCCGEINRDDEDICHNCQNKKEDVFRFSDEEYLDKEYTYQLVSGKINSKDPDTILSAIPLLEQIPHWKDSDELLSKCEGLAQEAQSNNRYEEAIAKAKEDTKEALTDAISIMESLQGWNDSDDKIEIYKKRIIEIEENDKAQQELKKAKAKKIKLIAIASLICITGLILFNVVTKKIIPDNNYNKAVELMEKGDYEEAIAAFNALEDYKDSKEKATECQNCIDYDTALELMGKGEYQDAIAAFNALGDYKDSKEKAAECQNIIVEANYTNALELMKNGNYEEALAAFNALEDYKDSKEKVVECQKEIDYLKASKLMKEEKYEEARTEFIALKDYKDSKEKADKCRTSIFKNPSVGSIVYFGKYEQDNNPDNGKEEIEWIVLAKNGKQYLVVSKYALDYRECNSEHWSNGITWEGCSLRKWLNGKFMENAFASDEQEKILTTTVTADKYSKGGRDAGNDTEDQVFLLSTKEVKKYFSKEEDRRCAPTPYAEKKGVYADEDYLIDDKGACRWWLRTPGKADPPGYSGWWVNATFYCVESDGSYGKGTDLHVNYDEAIRPALWINP